MKNTPRRPAVLTEGGEAKTSTVASSDLRAIGIRKDITVTYPIGCIVVSAQRMHEAKLTGCIHFVIQASHRLNTAR